MYFSKKLDNTIRSILKTSDIIMPIFKAFVLSSELSRDFVREASATALSAESRISKPISMGSSVRISDQLSI